MPKIRTGGAAAVVLAAVSCAHAQDQVFLPIPLGDEANARLEEAPLEGYSAPLSSDDPLVLAGLPFAHSTGQWAWNSHLDDTGEGSRAITVPLGGMRPDFLVTQLNTYWGRVNFRAGVMTFFLTSGEDVSFELIGNVHVRDWYVGGTTNNIDPAIGGLVTHGRHRQAASVAWTTSDGALISPKDSELPECVSKILVPIASPA